MAALSVVFAGQGAAEVWPDGRNGAQLSTEVSPPDYVDRAVANLRNHVLAPDDRVRIHRTGLSNPVSSPDLVDRALANLQLHAVGATNPGSSSPDLVDRTLANLQLHAVGATNPGSVTQSGESFDWGAAGVGASTAAALLLAFGVGIAMARRSRAPSATA